MPRPGPKASKTKDELPFWQRKSLREMTRAEWDSLCDGCGLCCLPTLEDIDTGEITYSNIACRLLDRQTCRCTNYPERQRYVPDCVALTPAKVETMGWLPKTCAYRLVANGRDLYAWHPLKSGNPESVHKAKISARGRTVPETEAGDLEDHLVDWVKQSG